MEEADVSFETGRATVVYDSTVTTPERLVEAFESESGYRATILAAPAGPEHAVH